MPQPDLSYDQCRTRQRRLIEVMQVENLDLVIVQRIEHVQWLTGFRSGWPFEPAAALSADGWCLLVAPQQTPESSAADEMTSYQAKRHSTMRNDQREASSAALLKALGNRVQAERVGVEFSCCGPHTTAALTGELADIEPHIYRLRRQKHDDELAMLRHAIAATGKMYERAREVIQPGVGELHVFNELQAAAVESQGEMLTGTGNDYASGARGGPPRQRTCQAGELYILDLGPAYRGYFADNCRAIAVDRQPTGDQLAAWEQLSAVFPYIEETVKPGVSCKAVFEEVNRRLNDYLPDAFNHHLGHGIGLFPHEAPHLNPNWDDTFQVGEVFTVEPGLYAPNLNAGIRLENDYLVTEQGVELLSDFPLELA